MPILIEDLGMTFDHSRYRCLMKGLVLSSGLPDLSRAVTVSASVRNRNFRLSLILFS